MEKLSNHFESLINWIKDPVIIFIDDLDRCTGEYAEGDKEKIDLRRTLSVGMWRKNIIGSCINSLVGTFHNRNLDI